MGPVPCDGDVVRRVSAQLLQLGLLLVVLTPWARRLALFSLGEDVLHRWLQKMKPRSVAGQWNVVGDGRRCGLALLVSKLSRRGCRRSPAVEIPIRSIF